MVTLTELEHVREIGSTGKVILVLLWLAGIAFAGQKAKLDQPTFTMLQ